MTDWRTVNIPKKFKDEISQHIEDTSFGSVKEFIIYSTRKEIEKQNTEDLIRKVLKEEELIE